MKKNYLQPITVTSPFGSLMTICSGTTVSAEVNIETGDEPQTPSPSRIPL